jgi:PAS domain S-box-containing protein
VSALGGVGRGRLDARVELPLNDELGDLAAAFNDMAARLERMTVSRAYLDQILGALAEGVFVVDREFRIRRVNRGAAALAGVAAADIEGRDLRQLLRHADGTPWRGEPGEARARELELAADDGSRRPVLLALAPLTEADASAGDLVCTATDITLLKEAERALARSHDDLRLAYLALQRIQEEERARLAREVHDEFGAVLTVMNHTLFLLSDALPPDAARGAELIPQLHELVRRASDASDRIVNGLHPPILDHFGLEAALEWYVDDFRMRSGLATRLALSELPELSSEQTLAIFRVVQECLTNVSRHARARRIDVRVQVGGGCLRVTIDDDGIGLGGHDTIGRAGLRGMQERLRALGGELELGRAPAGGTRVAAALPIAAGAAAVVAAVAGAAQ